MTTKEQVKHVLEKLGFPILQENDNSLAFCYQMNYVQANITDGADTNAIVMTLSGIFSADNEEEWILGIRTCKSLNYNLLQVKIYIYSDSDIIIAAEFFHKTRRDMEYLLAMALQSVIIAKKRFLQRHREIEDEVKLISELERE